MTGAVIPEGTEVVVPVEDTDFNFREPGVEAPGKVQIYSSPHLNGNIRFAGEDVRSGPIGLHHALLLEDEGLLDAKVCAGLIHQTVGDLAGL